MVRCLRSAREVFAVAVLLATLVGCTESNHWGDWEAQPLADAHLDVRQTSRTCRTCIVLSEQTRIAYADGPGIVDETHYVAIDSLQRIWNSRSSGHIVYSAKGVYLATVGRRGQGPLEFSSAGPIFVDSSGLIHLVDEGGFRETIVGPDLALREIRSLPGQINDVTSYTDGRTAVVSGLFNNPQSIGKPLHRLDSGRVVLSFGEPNDTAYSMMSSALARVVATTSRGFILAGHRNEYELDLYSPQGIRHARIRRPDAWPGVKGVPATFTMESELPGLMQDIAVAPGDRAWVLSYEPREDWKDNARAVVLPNGEPSVMPKDMMRPWRRSRLELIDLKTGTLEGVYITDAMLWGFLGHDRIYGYVYTDAGEPQLVISAVRFDGTRPNTGEHP